MAQERQVAGKVTDAADGSPLPGVTVMIKGTERGTATDVNGMYALKVPKYAVLVFSFVGMSPQEVRVGDKTVVNVALKAVAHSLDEVVVTALGIKRSQKSLGYSAASVSSKDLENARTTDVVSAVSGKIAGVQVNSTSSDPGASNSVIIRGISSLNGSNQPLYVIDGVPMNNSAVYSSDGLNSGFDFGSGSNLVNPENVENMTILKGAAATALYGSRAANGVVLITTKSGRKSTALGITISSAVQVSDVLRLPKFQNAFGQGADGAHIDEENMSWGPAFDGRLHLWGHIYNNSQKLKPFSPMKDNVKDFFETGVMTSNNINLNGGNDQTTFNATYGNVVDNGIVPGDKDRYVKNTFSVNASHDFGKVQVFANVNLGEQKNSFASTGQGLTMINSLYQIPRDISIIGLKDYEDDPFDQPDYYFTPYGVMNPYWILDHIKNDFRQQKMFGKIQVDVELLPGLKGTYRLGYDATDNEAKFAFPKIELTPGTPNYGQVSDPGSTSKQMSRRRELNHEFILSYDKKWTRFGLNAVAGFNLNERSYSDLYAGVEGMDIPGFDHLSNSAATPSVSENTEKRRLAGVFAQAELEYNELLYLTLTARNDWSSTLPKGARDFFYPGVTLSFAFSELFPQRVKDVFTYGKVRLAYGKTGNDAPPYSINPYYGATSVYNAFGTIAFPLGGMNAYTYGNRMGNSSLSPEISTEFEAGLYFTLFNGRITLDGSYYNRNSDKQIFPLGMDPATGFTSQTTNLGKVSNKGVELLLTLEPVKIGDFKWKLTTNFTRNKNKVESLPEELGNEITIYGFGTSSASTNLIARTGHEIGEFKVTMPKRTPDGRIVVNPENGMPVADPDLQYYEDVNSDFEMGITNNFSYKGWNLNFSFDIRHGGYMYSRTASITAFAGTSVQTLYNGRNPFVVPHSVNEVKLPDGSIGYVENTTAIANDMIDDYLDKGRDKLEADHLIPRGFVKLRNISLSYTFPKKWFASTPIHSLQLSVYGNNLFLWTPKANSYIDPELSSFGNDLEGRFGEYSANPTTRRVGFGLKLMF